MAARASLTKDLFVSWVTGIGRSPTVINDLNQATMGTLPSLDPHQHLSMNCIRLLLIEIRKQLETISSDGSGQHDTDTITKVKSLLLEFQTASQSYEQKMNEFKIATHNRLIEQCGQQGNVLEMYCVIGTNENNEPKSDWIKVTVCNFDQQANRVLVRKSNDNTMSYAAIDSATLRLPENDNNNHNNNSNTQQQIIQQSKTNGNTNNNNQNQNNMQTINRSQSVNTNSNVQIQTQQQQTQQYQWNNVLPRANSSPNPRAMGMGIPSMGLPSMGQQMNFGSIPSFPTMAVSAVSASGLPSFDNLTNNNINNRHTISNTINTNNNISINGTNEPIIIDQNDNNNNNNNNNNINNNNNNNQSNIISTKSSSSSSSKSSRKRKREDKHSHKSHKKHKKKKHKRDSDSDSDSDTSSNIDSDIDSD
eukprot:863005_1